MEIISLVLGEILLLKVIMRESFEFSGFATLPKAYWDPVLESRLLGLIENFQE